MDSMTDGASQLDIVLDFGALWYEWYALVAWSCGTYRAAPEPPQRQVIDSMRAGCSSSHFAEGIGIQAKSRIP